MNIKDRMRFATEAIKFSLSGRFKQASQIYGNSFFGSGGALISDNFDAFIKDGYQANAALYSVINLVTRSVSMVPWQLFEVENKKMKRKYMNMVQDNQMSNKAMIFKAQNLIEVDGHRAIKTLNRPNPIQGKSEWTNNLLGYKLSTGNGFVQGTPIETGRHTGEFKELWIMPSQWTNIKLGNDKLPLLYTLRTNANFKEPAENVMHIAYWNPDPTKYPYGMSPIQAARSPVTANNDSWETNKRMLQNSGAFGMMTSKADEFNETITDEQRDQLEASWDRKVTRPQNKGKIFFASTPLQWTQFGMSSVDMQIIENLKFSKRDICSVYQVPSELLNDSENKTYSNMREARKAMITNAALPELLSLRDELNRWFIPPFEKNDGKQYILDVDIMAIPELQKEMETWVKTLKLMDWITPNEKRIATQFGKDENNPEMDQYWFPANLIPFGMQQD